MAKIYLQRREAKDYGTFICDECYIGSFDAEQFNKFVSRFCRGRGNCIAGIHKVLKQVIPTKLIKGDNHGLK